MINLCIEFHHAQGGKRRQCLGYIGGELVSFWCRRHPVTHVQDDGIYDARYRGELHTFLHVELPSL
ncbi:hypothetical protein D3C81_658700 [compost metagenome]